MGYAEAAHLPAITGLYASLAALVAYAAFGPSRILVLGPDSALAALIASIVLPLAGAHPERAAMLAGMLAILSGSLCIGVGLQYAVNRNQELIALGAANLAAGLLQGFPVTSSSSRTPVAEAAGARTQLTSVIAALSVAMLLLFAPALFRTLPNAALGAVVVAACLGLFEIRSVARLLRLRPSEFARSMACFACVSCSAFTWLLHGNCKAGVHAKSDVADRDATTVNLVPEREFVACEGQRALLHVAVRRKAEAGTPPS